MTIAVTIRLGNCSSINVMTGFGGSNSSTKIGENQFYLNYIGPPGALLQTVPQDPLLSQSRRSYEVSIVC